MRLFTNSRSLRFGCALALGCAAGPISRGADPAPQPFREIFPPPSDNYTAGAESRPQPGVPAGKFFEFALNDSKIFPGTARQIQVYVPTAYRGDSASPACLMVFPDGIGFHASEVFDQLIARHELPIIIAVGIKPGVVTSPESALDPRFQRSFELDNLTDRFARLVLEEVLPAVEQHPTSDGRRIYLSRNPDDRGTAGASTGGIAAFTLAWLRPESFHRVFTALGSFVGMRGGEKYYVLVRKSEPLPLRIYLEDGVHDAAIPLMGDWWMSNQTMARSLSWAGYAVNHAWGANTHNPAHAAQIFPEAMRWLWQAWPAPVSLPAPGNPVLRETLLPGESWQTANSSEGRKLLDESRIDDPAFAKLSVRAVTRRSTGELYATVISPAGDDELWRILRSGERVRLDQGIKGAGGLAFSPNGQWLFVTQHRSRWSLSYRVRADGALNDREPFYDAWVPDWADDAGASAVCFDVRGYAFVATRVGVQIFDRNGRVVAILPLPRHEPATGIGFAAGDPTLLWVKAGPVMYLRRMKVEGAKVGAPPIELPKWTPG